MSVSNKKIGTEFEKRICNMLNHDGWWVHFIEPKQSGAQPFDIIAVKDGRAIAIDCKTCASGKFSISRLEDNQIFAFEKWLECGNDDPYIFVEHGKEIYAISYLYLRENKIVKLEEKWRLL